MTQTREVRNDKNTIQTDIELLVDTSSLDLLSNILDVPLQLKLASSYMVSWRRAYTMA